MYQPHIRCKHGWYSNQRDQFNPINTNGPIFHRTAADRRYFAMSRRQGEALRLAVMDDYGNLVPAFK